MTTARMVLASRFRFASRYGWAHLGFSFIVASLIAALIFGLWFPYPYRELTGGRELFWIIISVDVVCGPLLTWVVSSPSKLRRQLLADIGIIVAVQLAALGYGLYILSEARPVALVFEVDRYRAVTVADIDPQDLAKADASLQSLSLTGPHLFGVRSPRNADESFEAATLGLAGIEVSMRPQWWLAYPQVVNAALAKAKPVSQLRAKFASRAQMIEDAIKQSGLAESQLLWLPLVSRRTSDWVVMIDKANGLPKAFLPLDGFF